MDARLIHCHSDPYQLSPPCAAPPIWSDHQGHYHIRLCDDESGGRNLGKKQVEEDTRGRSKGSSAAGPGVMQMQMQLS